MHVYVVGHVTYPLSIPRFARFASWLAGLLVLKAALPGSVLFLACTLYCDDVMPSPLVAAAVFV